MSNTIILSSILNLSLLLLLLSGAALSQQTIHSRHLTVTNTENELLSTREENEENDPPVRITRYSNSAWVDSKSSMVEYADSLEDVVLSKTSDPFSVRVETGMDLPDASKRYAFDCEFSDRNSTSVVVFVYLEDHLICHTTPYPFSESAFSRDGTTSSPLANITLSSTRNRLVVRAYGENASDYKMTLRWNTNVEIPTTNQSGFETIESSFLSTYTPSAPELERQQLQNSEESSGWSLWDSGNLLSIVRLPSGSALKHGICKLSSNECIQNTYIEDPSVEIRVNPYAADRSYFSYYLAWKGVNISISYVNASDPAFPPLGYWRGYVWGPMAQLVYFSLREYDHLEIVRKGRKALCSQMKKLMLSQWHSNRHICENYNPHRNGTDCTGTKFYHWGALTGLISLLEEGLY